MDPERWKRIDEIFHAALDCEPSDRAAFLSEACKEDDSLRAEIEDLISCHEKESTLFENPATDLAAEFFANESSYQGTISHYQIIKKLGSGGMGEVFLAEDTRLNRKVALKVLPSKFTKDKYRIRRFVREARAASALNHPNILVIYDVGQVDSTNFIVSEYIEGETLRQLMLSGKMPLKQILTIVVQVAEALDAAHRAGIVHRDIKPENIMVRSDGYAKVLDFGLAKLAEPSVSFTDIQTQSLSDTVPGLVLGTVRYMSPEQARGLKLDARSDIFSLGVVLYEMIVARPPFDGPTTSDVLAAILDREPAPLGTHGEFPDEMQWIITKALAKDPEERYQTSKELLADLKRIRKGLEIEEERKRYYSTSAQIFKPWKRALSRPKRTVRWLIGIGILLILSSVPFLLKLRTAQNTVVPEYHQITFTGKASVPSISPDGKFVAYVTESTLIVQDTSGGQPLELYRTENGRFDDTQPRWSPDASQIAFTVHSESDRGVFIIPKLGGTPRKIASRINFVAWAPDGNEVAMCFQPSKEILFKNLLTGAARTIPLQGSFTWIHDLDWSSLGKLLLLTVDENTKSYQIWTINADGSNQQKIREEHEEITAARWTGDGKAIYYMINKESTKNLVRIPLDAREAGSVAMKTLLTGLEAEGVFSNSRNGREMAFSKEFLFSNLWSARTEDFSGVQVFKAKQLTTGTSNMFEPSFSPDGTRIVFSVGNEAKANLFIMKIDDGSSHQITFMNSCSRSPSWSPDGKSIAFGSTHKNKSGVWIVNADGEGLRELSHTQLSSSGPIVLWGPGSKILYHTQGNRNYSLLDLNTGIEQKLIPNDSVGWIDKARLSPDRTKLVAFWNQRSIRGLFIVSLVDSSQKLLKEGEWEPIGWSKDGNYVYAINEKSEVSKISLLDGKVIEMPELPFKKNLVLWDGQTDLSADERQFIFNVPEKRSDVWIVSDFDPDVPAESSPPE